ncbi:MAG: glycosyltransferase [Candidatus Sumerlaeota bacterium]|nr:glycosyltransferase [Candidatus Sumerlaeota bacterium]
MKKISKPSIIIRTLFSSGKLLLRLFWLYLASLLARRLKGGKDGNNNLMVFYSQVVWCGVWQRPQEEAMGFAEKRRVLYVSPVQAHEPLVRYPDWKRVEHIDKGHGIMVFSPLIFSGQYRSGVIFRLNRFLLTAELRWMLRKEGSIIFFTNSPFVNGLPERLKARRIIYDVIDDFVSFTWAPAGAAEMEQRLLTAADIVFTGTHTLYEEKRNLRRDATFVPCGVDFEKFYKPEGSSPLPEPDDIRTLPKPLIGYIGTLSERIDTDIIAGLAMRLPRASIVLIGPVHRGLDDLPHLPNIHYLGLKRHDDLPAYLHYFKVALLPFKLTKAAKAINPVKTLEYLAAGCLVVSTAIPDVVRFYSGVVEIASSREDFIEKTVRLIEGNEAWRVKRGIELARHASWRNMVEIMEAFMQQRE